MDPTQIRRLGTMMIASALLAAACSGGFGGASPSAAPSAPASVAPSAEPSVAAEEVTLTYLVDDTEATQARAAALTEAYTALHPNVTFEIETRLGGTDGDNIVKTRLSTGEMTDIFWYNSGSLLQALNPAESLVDVSGEPWIANINESYLPTVSAGDKIFGAPSETAMGGGILYNKKVYADLGLSVPTTWAEFAANNEKIKAADIAPVAATFGDTWTSQLFVLADYFNVQTAVPDFAEKYTTNEAHYATRLPRWPASSASRRRTTRAGGRRTSPRPSSTAVSRPSPKARPPTTRCSRSCSARSPRTSPIRSTTSGSSPSRVTAPTARRSGCRRPHTSPRPRSTPTWPRTSSASSRRSRAPKSLTSAIAPSGPYVINGSSLPADVLPAVKDIQTYLEANATAPALEFLSPVKGPALEQLTVAVGTGQYSAEEAAALYDQDVEKAAKQLGLPGWE